VDADVTSLPRSQYLRSYSLSADGDIVAAPGAGNYLLIHQIQVSNSNASYDVEIKITEGSGGTALLWWYIIRQGGGYVWRSNRGYRLAENTALYLDVVTGTSPSLRVSVEYDVVTA
jgi:hypothetical protein